MDRKASTQWASEGTCRRRPIRYVALYTPDRPWCDVGQVTMLPNVGSYVALPRIFDLYITYRSVAHADARVSKMVKYRF